MNFFKMKIEVDGLLEEKCYVVSSSLKQAKLDVIDYYEGYNIVFKSISKIYAPIILGVKW